MTNVGKRRARHQPKEPCKFCNGIEWVCENHPAHAAGDMCCDMSVCEYDTNGDGDCGRPACPVCHPQSIPEGGHRLCEHGACHCGGAGTPCPVCDPTRASAFSKGAVRVVDKMELISASLEGGAAFVVEEEHFERGNLDREVRSDGTGVQRHTGDTL